MSNKYIIFQGMTADKDGNKSMMGRVALNSSQIVGVLECVDKHECVIPDICAVLLIGGGQISVQGKLEDIIEQLNTPSYE